MDHLAGGLRDGLDPDLVVVVEFLGLTRLTEFIHAQTQRLAAEHAPDEGTSMRVAVHYGAHRAPALLVWNPAPQVGG